eukprot:5764121-Pyramimonas_sp.AAC.1
MKHLNCSRHHTWATGNCNAKSGNADVQCRKGCPVLCYAELRRGMARRLAVLYCIVDIIAGGIRIPI